MMTWEGGVRVPCVMRWPQRIPAGQVSDQMAATIDLLPTLAAWAGAPLPKDRTIDGKDLTRFLTGKTAKSPRDTFYYYCFTHLQAVRQGKWKLVLPRPARPWTRWYARMIDEVPAPQLYDLNKDLAEENDVAAKHPEVVATLEKLADAARRDLGDYNRTGKGRRRTD